MKFNAFTSFFLQLHTFCLLQLCLRPSESSTTCCFNIFWIFFILLTTTSSAPSVSPFSACTSALFCFFSMWSLFLFFCAYDDELLQLHLVDFLLFLLDVVFFFSFDEQLLRSHLHQISLHQILLHHLHQNVFFPHVVVSHCLGYHCQLRVPPH